MSIDLTNKHCVVCSRIATSVSHIAYTEYINYLAPVCDNIECGMYLNIYNENKKSDVLYKLANSKINNNLISSFDA